LESLLLELHDLGYYDIVVIDGKSIDQTWEVAKKHGAKVMLQKGLGKGDAVIQVLKEVPMDVDAMVLMDADGSMDPKEIPSLVEGIISGADLVKGSRFLKEGYTYDMSALRRMGNSVFVSLVNLLFRTKFSDLCYGFIVFNKQSVKVLSPLLKSRNFEIETEIIVEATKAGLKVIEVPSTEFERKNGNSNLHTFRDGFKILQTIFRGFLPKIDL